MNSSHESWAHRAVCAAATILAIAGLAGCVTIGQPFAANRVSTIELGKTRQDEIVQTFGQPFRTGIEDGDITWTYVHYRLRLLGPQETEDLYVRFKADGTVKSYSFNSNAPEDSPKKP